MVKLEEVDDEELDQAQPGPIGDSEDDADYVDTDSSLSDDEEEDDFTAPHESITDRILALRDILPPSTRRTLSTTFSRTSSLAKTTALYGGKSLWVLSTSALMLMVPFAIAFVEEQQIVEQERELKAQEGLREGLTPDVAGAEQGRAAGVGANL
ncbi:MAG: hypothetical protein Q9217_001375 [Psora testacea]